MLKWVKGSQNGNKENEILTKNKDFKEIICCDEKEAPPTEEKKTEKETEKTEKAGKDEHFIALKGFIDECSNFEEVLETLNFEGAKHGGIF